ncbi:MAG: TldD/PmbA family protein [Candidatus Thorarchaeota archaeon]|nr:TldD/PmbA family protein [Candidatus Thorarchaeota archaeon]
MKFQRDDMLEKASLILSEAERHEASQAEACIFLEKMALTRLANSIIDQNVSENRASFRVTLYYGKKKGTVVMRVFDSKSIKDAVESAAKIARISPEVEEFKSLPSPKPYSSALEGLELASKNTVNATPEQRADFAMLAINTAHDIDRRVKAVAGAISHFTTQMVLANSLGIEAYNVSTRCNINLTVLADDGTEETAGWAADNRRDFSKLEVTEVSRIASSKAVNGFGMKDLELGEYEVVLEPAAVSDLVFYMTYIGFSALSYQEYRSFLRDRLGEKIFSESLSVVDDPFDDRFANPRAFDDEGVPKAKLDMVDKGVVKNLVYNTLTASKDGVESTGHHSLMWGTPMPFARHVLVHEGASSLDEMIAETKRGILITHFHYQNPVDPTKGIMTGLTRDGTWFIENGEVKWPLRTLRYTDAIPRILGNIDLIGKYENLMTSDTEIVPPMKLPSFRISGSSSKG